MVFDVIKVSDTSAKIILQAAGGTLPLKINCNEKGEGGWEVHDVFGVDTNIMVNTKWTGSNSADKPAVELGTISGDFTEANFYTTVKNIPVRVQKTNSTTNEKIWCLLEAPKGQAPSKFGCPITLLWVNERVFIDGVYNFTEWVTGEDYTLKLRTEE